MYLTVHVSFWKEGKKERKKKSTNGQIKHSYRLYQTFQMVPLMATVKDTTYQGGGMERIYKDDGSSTGKQTGD